MGRAGKPGRGSELYGSLRAYRFKYRFTYVASFRLFAYSTVFQRICSESAGCATRPASHSQQNRYSRPVRVAMGGRKHRPSAAAAKKETLPTPNDLRGREGDCDGAGWRPPAGSPTQSVKQAGALSTSGPRDPAKAPEGPRCRWSSWSHRRGRSGSGSGC